MKTDLYITTPGAKLGIQSNKFYVRHPSKDGKGRILKKIPVENVNSIVIMTKVVITTDVYRAVFKRHIPIYFLSSKGDYLGKVEPLEASNISLRYQQYKLFFDPKFQFNFSQSIVYGKIENQKRLLKRYRKNFNLNVDEEIEQLESIQAKVNNLRASNKNFLLGYEGMASRYYFLALGKIFKGKLAFTKRTKRPPKDPINSLLSFGYTLLAQTVFTNLKLRNLDVYCGYFHSPKDNRPILVLDMMEEWRSLVIDSLIVSLYKKGYITEKGFEYILDEQGKVEKVLIKDFLRNKFIEEYNKRLGVMISYDKRKVTIRQAILNQAYQLVRVINGKKDKYEPYIFNY